MGYVCSFGGTLASSIVAKNEALGGGRSAGIGGAGLKKKSGDKKKGENAEQE